MSGAHHLLPQSRFGIRIRVLDVGLAVGEGVLGLIPEEVLHQFSDVVDRILHSVMRWFTSGFLCSKSALADFISSINCLSSEIPFEFWPSKAKICPYCSSWDTAAICLLVRYWWVARIEL
jgi:hypothetical protein